MIESFTLNHTALVLETVTPAVPADVALRQYFTANRRLGPRERRAISRAVFTYFRWFGWLDGKASLQKQVEHAAALQERFLREPKCIKPETLAVRAVPGWLKDEMELPPDCLRQLQHEPALWLRARPGRAGQLASELGDCEKTDLASDALRYTGTQDLFRTPQFHAGAFEIQDLSSQLTGILAAPNPGETWWDACAGEGGKTLHLADLMHNKGLIWATDRSVRRLDTLRRRAGRAKLFNYRTAPWDGSPRLPTKTKFDGILVDAPCSGVGTWQRNPHARWTVSPGDVRALAATQRTLLENTCGSLKPGGRLVYAVCTLTRSETHAVADAFTAAHTDFEPSALKDGDSLVTLRPHELNANGMFIAAWRRKA